MGNISQTGVELLAEAVHCHLSDVPTQYLFTPSLLFGAQNYQPAFTQVSCLLAVRWELLLAGS